METRRDNPPRTSCTLCLTCINSVLKPDQSWRCAVGGAQPMSLWDCDHYVRRFRHMPLVERRRLPRPPSS